MTKHHYLYTLTNSNNLSFDLNYKNEFLWVRQTGSLLIQLIEQIWALQDFALVKQIKTIYDICYDASTKPAKLFKPKNFKA